jgi:hypothetical protein
MRIGQHEYPIIDPLMLGLELPHVKLFHPAGFPVEISSDSPLVLQAAEASWGAIPARFSRPPLAIHFAVADTGATALPPPPVFRARRHLVSIVADSENFAVCDYTQRFAFCWTTSATVASPEHFRYNYLEAVVYTLLVQCEVTPVHAACVASGGFGILLCGESGAGKTTLAYTCARHGWTYVCDDTSMLPRSYGEPVVLGNPQSMRFRSDAAQVPPELAARFAATRPNRKPSVEIPTAALGGIRTAFECPVHRLVFLERRNSGPAELCPLAPEQAIERLTRNIALYDRPVVERHIETLRALTRTQASELRYSTPEQALEVLECLAQTQGRASSAQS